MHLPLLVFNECVFFDVLVYVCTCFPHLDPEQAKLLLPAYERILTKRLRSVFTETRAHTVDDFMTG